MKTISRTHKIALDPTCKRQVYFSKACGVARFAWNWGLAKWEAGYKEGKKVNGLALKKEFNQVTIREADSIVRTFFFMNQCYIVHF